MSRKPRAPTATRVQVDAEADVLRARFPTVMWTVTAAKVGRTPYYEVQGSGAPELPQEDKRALFDALMDLQHRWYNVGVMSGP